MLMRVFLGWLRGERKHCSMVAIPTLEPEDAKRRAAAPQLSRSGPERTGQGYRRFRCRE
jgi:hypothetical protein